MQDKRLFPRIESDWPLFLVTDGGKKQIGYVKNISLSGAVLFFFKEHDLYPDKNNFLLKLRNPQMSPEELTLEGLREWTSMEGDEATLALSLEEVKGEKRKNFVRFLSRSDKLHVEAFLYQKD